MWLPAESYFFYDSCWGETIICPGGSGKLDKICLPLSNLFLAMKKPFQQQENFGPMTKGFTEDDDDDFKREGKFVRKGVGDKCAARCSSLPNTNYQSNIIVIIIMLVIVI